MTKRLRVYLSSTYEDLRAFREAVFAGMAKAGLDVTRMEDYTAADERPVDRCLRDVGQSDIYVGLYAWRYGYIPPPEHGNPDGRSITELEYRKAKECKLRKLLFFAHPDTYEHWPERFKDGTAGAGERGARITALRSEFGTEKTASFFRTPDELATLVLAAIMRTGLTERPYNVPPRPPGYVARPHRTQALIEALLGKASGANGANTLVQGPGGFGKTALMIDACHRPEVVSAFPDGILWTVLGKEPDLSTTLRDLYVLATGSAPAVAGPDAIAQSLGKALEARRCLVVVDDVWRPEALGPLLRLSSPRFLVTTRIANLLGQMGESGWADVPVDEMQPDEAVALLERGLPVDHANREALLGLADQLGCWPLLLELANARLLEEHRTRGGELASSIDRVVTVLEKRGVLGFDRRDSGARNGAVSNSIKAGLSFAEESCAGVSRKAAELSIFPEDIPVPTRVLADFWEMDEVDVEEDVLRVLANLSIVRWDRQNSTVHLHDMVRRALETFLSGDAAPLHQRLVDAWGGEVGLLPHRYAWQWICWHLLRAGRSSQIRNLVLSVPWIEAKIRQTGFIDLLGDMDLLPEDAEVSQVKTALLLSTSTVSTRPEQVAEQLESRLPQSVWQRLHRRTGSGTGHRRLRNRLATLAQVGGPIVKQFSLGERTIQCASKLDDGHLLLACDAEGLLSLDVENGAIASYYRTGGDPSSIAASDDGHLVAYAEREAPAIHVLERGVRIHTLLGHEGTVYALALGNHGRTVVSAGRDKTVRFWDTNAGTEKYRLQFARGTIPRLCAVRNTNLASIVEDRSEGADGASVKFFDLERQVEVGEATLPFGSVALVASSSDGRMLACSGSYMNALVVVLLDAVNREFIGHLGAAPGLFVNTLSSIAFSADDRLLLAGTMLGELLIWDIASSRLVHRRDAHHNHVAFMTPMADHVVTLGWSPTYELGKGGHKAGNVKVWIGDVADLASSPSSGPRVERHGQDASALALSAEGDALVSGSYDRTVAIWDTEKIERKRTLNIRGGVVSVSINREDDVYAALGNYYHDSGVVDVWAISSGARHCEIETSELGRSVALTQDGDCVLIGTLDTLDVHAAGDGSKIGTMSLSTHGRNSYHSGALCLLPDSRVAVGFEDGRIEVWDFASRRRLREITAHNAKVVGLHVTDEGRRLISICAAGEIRIWDALDGTPVGMIANAGTGVVAGAASAGAPFAVTAGESGEARVWDLDRGEIAATFSVDAPLSSCAISGDGTRVYLGDSAGYVHFLQLEEA